MRAHNQKILLWLSVLVILGVAPFIYKNSPQDIDTKELDIEKIETVSKIKIESATSIPVKSPTEKATQNEIISTPEKNISVNFTAGTFSTSTKINLGENVYGLMLDLKKKGFKFESRNFGEGLGYFVYSINKIKNNEIGATYWTLYVNEKESVLGASSYVLKDGDSILWKFENRN